MGDPRHAFESPVDPTLTPSERQAEANSLGDLLAEVSRDVSTLMRQEVELAKAEIRESAKRAGRGAGLLGGAGVAGMLALVFLSVALWWGLGYLMGNAWSAVIVAVLWGIVALRLAQPIVLLQLGANVASAVFVIASLHLLWLNTRLLPRELRPPAWRRAGLVLTALFYGFFVALSLQEVLRRAG